VGRPHRGRRLCVLPPVTEREKVLTPSKRPAVSADRIRVARDCAVCLTVVGEYHVFGNQIEFVLNDDLLGRTEILNRVLATASEFAFTIETNLGLPVRFQFNFR